MAEEKHTVKVLALEWVTHDVRRVVVEKPKDYDFTPGQATEVSINKEGWEDEARPFTFTSQQNDPCLEFTIKVYKDHDGVTEQIGKLERGDELIIRDVWGAIEYKGPGYFIAGGAGVISVIGEGFPKEFSKMVKLALDKKVDEAYKIHYKIAPAIDYIFAEGNPAGIKAVFKNLGICGDTVRLPLVGVSDGLRSKIDGFIKKF
jgi:predicted ferric reductase